jgi:hypothetical protein
MPKPPFRPQAAGTIGFFFSIVAGALVSVVSLRRMGHLQKAKRIFWITILGATLMATILILIPDALGRFFGLGLEVVGYLIYPKIQDLEFREWEATHPEIAPSSGWKAVGWGFAGLAAFLAILIAMGIFLDATGIAPQ